MAKTIGIDLGTTNSCMAVLEGGEPHVIENAEGARTTPSVVAFTASGERLVGTVAKRQAVTNPENTVFSIKRFMGRKEGEVKEEEKIVPFKVVHRPQRRRARRGRRQGVLAAGDQRDDPPEAEGRRRGLPRRHRGQRGDHRARRTSTTTSARPPRTPARSPASRSSASSTSPPRPSLAYGLDKETDQTILVFDLGGGTFDVSVLEIGDGVFEVKSTAGDNHLGGDNFDKAIVDWLVAEFKKARASTCRRTRWPSSVSTRRPRRPRSSSRRRRRRRSTCRSSRRTSRGRSTSTRGSRRSKLNELTRRPARPRRGPDQAGA